MGTLLLAGAWQENPGCPARRRGWLPRRAAGCRRAITGTHPDFFEITRKPPACQFAAEGLKSARTGVDITNFLKDWLAKHIRETDRKYGPFLSAKAVA